MMPPYPLTETQRGLLARQDAKMRRCWYCGEHVYDQQDCGTCAAPVDREAFKKASA